MNDRIADPWGERTPYAFGEAWPVRVDALLDDGLSEADVDGWVQTASVLHSNGDGYEFAVKDGRIVGVRGRADDRVNRGRLDVKDLYGWQANAAPDRLRRPLVRDGERLVEADWDTAMGRIVERSRALLDRPGGWGRFGFYTSGQLFLEEYYTPRGDREGGTRHAAHGRQHAALHGGGGGVEGVVRHGWSAGLLHGRRSLRRAGDLGAQRGGDADGAVDADARPSRGR